MNQSQYREKLTDAQRDLLESLLSPGRLARLRQALSMRLSCITLVLDNLLDPHNMAAIVRSLESFGCQDLHVIESDYAFDPSSRVTKHSHKWVTVHRYPDAATCLGTLRSSGFSIYAAMVANQSRPLSQIPLEHHEPTAFVLGNEHAGVRPETLALSDGGFYIPMYGFSESFNVSVASALVLQYAVSRRRQTLPENQGTLSPERHTQLYDLWLQKSVKNSPRLLQAGD